MQTIINGSKISFLDDNNFEIMYMDYSTDECIWWFNSNDVITITENTKLFELLRIFMNQQYDFCNNEILKSFKKDNQLVWYSDCYFNPDDKLSLKSVSYLNIEYNGDCFKLWCVKPLDEIINRKQKSHCICFSPLSNGKYVKNISSGLTLQDDFVMMVYQKLLEQEKIRKLK